MPRSLARGRENMRCVLRMQKGKEKTDEGSSVLLYVMTEEGERE